MTGAEVLGCGDGEAAPEALRPAVGREDSSLAEGAQRRPSWPAHCVIHRQTQDRLPRRGTAGNCEEKPRAEGIIYAGLPKKGEEKRMGKGGEQDSKLNFSGLSSCPATSHPTWLPVSSPKPLTNSWQGQSPPLCRQNIMHTATESSACFQAMTLHRACKYFLLEHSGVPNMVTSMAPALRKAQSTHPLLGT